MTLENDTHGQDARVSIYQAYIRDYRASRYSSSLSIERSTSCGCCRMDLQSEGSVKTSAISDLEVPHPNRRELDGAGASARFFVNSLSALRILPATCRGKSRKVSSKTVALSAKKPHTRICHSQLRTTRTTSSQAGFTACGLHSTERSNGTHIQHRQEQLGYQVTYN